MKRGGTYRKNRTGRIVFWLVFVEVIALIAGLLIISIPKDDPQLEELLNIKVMIPYETETEKEIRLGLAVPKPPWMFSCLISMNGRDPGSRSTRSARSLSTIWAIPERRLRRIMTTLRA